MKTLLTFALIALFGSTSLYAQHMKNEKRASPHDTVVGKNVTVTYGRPYKKGRTIFGGLEAYGKVWRVGADEATQITVTKDCTFGGQPLKAGTYTMFAIPNATEWTIILNSKLGQWGAFGYDKVKDQDVLKTTVRDTHSNAVTEQLTITLPADGMRIQWDQTNVFVPIKF